MKLFLALSCLLLAASACGFQPIHAKPEAGDETSQMLAMLPRINIITQHTREDDLLKAELEELFNPAGEAAGKEYELNIELQVIEQDLVILEDATASRKRVNLVSPYRLTRIADDALIDSGAITYNGSYAVQDDANFAAFTVKRDVRLRAIGELAERYKARMAGVFANFANPEAMALREQRKTEPARVIPENRRIMNSNRSLIPQMQVQ